MLKIENAEVLGWEHAIRGMRNPLNSWEKSDSFWNYRSCEECNGNASCIDDFHVGPNDLDLMTRLRNAGTDHRKFMRMITVYLDIMAPLYWWKEFDTYKVGTVANSCSTMHKIAEKPFTLEDFSCEHLDENEWCHKSIINIDGVKDAITDKWNALDILKGTIGALNVWRYRYINTALEKAEERKHCWWQMIQLLPSSYNQKRTVMLNYEVLANIYKSRRNHKLDEWHTFCDWIEGLPYSELITGKSNG